jgi:hypothetical protein
MFQRLLCDRRAIPGATQHCHIRTAAYTQSNSTLGVLSHCCNHCFVQRVPRTFDSVALGVKTMNDLWKGALDFYYAWPHSACGIQHPVLTRLLSASLHESGKGKAIPLQAWTGPEGSRRLRHPDSKTIGTRKWQSCQPYTPTALTPRKHPWYSFLLEAESIPGPYCGRKDYVNEKFQWHHRESNQRPTDL